MIYIVRHTIVTDEYDCIQIAIICAHDVIVKKMAQVTQNGSSRSVMETNDIKFIPKSLDLYLKATANLGRLVFGTENN